MDLLQTTERAYHNVQTAADALYSFWEEFFGYIEAPGSFTYRYQDMTTKLRCIWIALDAAARELAAVHGLADKDAIKMAVLTIQRAREVMGVTIESNGIKSRGDF